MSQRFIGLLFVFLLAFSGCGKKADDRPLSTADNFLVMSPWYSFDDRYQMEASKNKTFVISEANKKLSDSNVVYRGTWSTDESNKSVLISYNGKTDSFTYFEPKYDNFSLLINGAFKNADLTQSWFAVFNSDEDSDAPDYSP